MGAPEVGAVSGAEIERQTDVICLSALKIAPTSGALTKENDFFIC